MGPISIFVLLTNLYIISSSHIATNVIYEIVAKIDEKTCYSCNGDCSLPSLITCSASTKCYTKITTSDNQTIESRGCVASNIEICKEQDSPVCYTCTDSFCNKRSQISLVNSEPIDLGVSQCYVCIDKCEAPPNIHNCQEVLWKEMQPVTAACLDYKLIRNNSVEIHRGCIPYLPDIKSACSMSALLNKDIECTICNTELCNEQPDTCYLCDGDCTTPIIEICNNGLGKTAKTKCVTLRYSHDNGTQINSKKCQEVGPAFQAECNKINQNGGECTICNTNLCNKDEVPSSSSTSTSSSTVLPTTTKDDENNHGTSNVNLPAFLGIIMLVLTAWV